MNSFEKVQNLISQMTSIPPLEWAYFIRHLKLHHLKKGDYFFREGENSTSIGIVTRGLIYTYYLTEDGKEKTKNFAWEGRLIAPYASIIQGKPANFTAIAIEPTLVVSFDGSQLKEFQRRHPCWERLTRLCAEKILIERELREYEHLTQNNEQRIQSFYNYYEPIIDRIPQYLIANYIGITPVSLSRIRAQRVSQ
jgi:CRP-like cAMP-binding protein